MTGLPGWLRFGFSPGWLGRSPTGLPPTAQWIVSSGLLPQYLSYLRTVAPPVTPPTTTPPITPTIPPTTTPGAPIVPFAPTVPTLTKEQERQMLEQQMKGLEAQLEAIRKRLEELKR